MTPDALPSAQPTSWLSGDAGDRARFTDTYTRFRDAHLFGLAVGGSTLLSAYWYGWRLLVLVVLGSVTIEAGKILRGRFARPEPVVAGAFVALELNLAVCMLLSGGGRSPMLALMAVPVFTQAVCFRPRVTAAGVLLSGLLAVAAALGAQALPPVRPAPAVVHVVIYLALLASLALAASYLAAAERQSRDDAVIDQLTGLFNRKALHSRFADAAAQARVLDSAVAVVLCDVDHFKDVNDTHGHDRGDLVLRELAYRLRSSLRTFDLVYRLGGEEFLLLLPGSDLAAATGLAERVRADVAAEPVGGLPVTVSAGVASARADGLDLQDMLKAADRALYAAKRAGRNRVRVAPAR